MTKTQNTTNQAHCSECGNTEYVGFPVQPYSGCCNERVSPRGCLDCHHTGAPVSQRS
jgi:hypothetical protein